MKCHFTGEKKRAFMRCSPPFLLPLARLNRLKAASLDSFPIHTSLSAQLGFEFLMSSATTNGDHDHPHQYTHDTPTRSAGSSSKAEHQAAAPPLSRYESQKRRDWNTFGQYLRTQRPPVPLPRCSHAHVLDFMRYLDQFGKTKVHVSGCVFFGRPDPPAPCACPLRQAWGSLDALVGRLRAAYDAHGGPQESNPFGNGAVRVYLREVRDSQAKARGIPYKKKKRKISHSTTTTMKTDDRQDRKQAMFIKEHHQIS